MKPLAPLTTLRAREEHILRLIDEATSDINDGFPTYAIRLLVQALYSAKPELHRECRSLLAALDR